MPLRFNIYLNIALLSVTTIFFSQTFAQNKIEKDPSGSITKYNTTFTGIGPKVYFLPPPKSIQDQLVDVFKSEDRQNLANKNSKKLDFQRLHTQLKSVSNINQLQYLLTSNPANTSDWNTLLTNISQNYDENIQAALLNEAGISALKDNNTTDAKNYFENALNIALRKNNYAQINTIQNNIVNFFLYIQDFQKAEVNAQSQYESAVQNKSFEQQADAWLNIAQARAKLKNYKEAEQNFIRKAIPLYNKAKDYRGKVIAWEYLAQMYFDQNKYTEAQWFLLQAQEIAKNKGFKEELAEIEYLLASSKLADKNFKVSKKEFLTANTLAVAEENKYLELAINDKLTEVYWNLKDYDKAEETYNNYLSLKAQLFSDKN